VRTCCVCDRLTFKSECTFLPADQGGRLVQRMKQRLSPFGLDEQIKQCYDVSELVPFLRGTLLSPRGIYPSNEGSGTPQLCICNECMYSLNRRKCHTPPKFAIANGLWIGSLDEPLMTRTEELMVARLSPLVRMKQKRQSILSSFLMLGIQVHIGVLTKGSQRVLRSHSLLFAATPGPPATMLPRSLDPEGDFKVIYAGPFTEKERLAGMRAYTVRRDVISRYLGHFKSKNHLYSDISISHERIEALPTNGVPDVSVWKQWVYFNLF